MHTHTHTSFSNLFLGRSSPIQVEGDAVLQKLFNPNTEPTVKAPQDKYQSRLVAFTAVEDSYTNIVTHNRQEEITNEHRQPYYKGLRVQGSRV